MTEYNEALLDQESGIEQDSHEWTPKPPVPLDEYNKPIRFDLQRVEENEGDFKFGFTKDDNIYFQVKFVIQGGELNGIPVRALLGTTPMRGRASTAADDYLRACGWTPSTKGRMTNREYLEAIQETREPFTATLDWELYCPDEPRKNNPDKTGVTVIRGYRNFPLSDDGKTRNHETECPECGEILSANAVVRRYMPV